MTQLNILHYSFLRDLCDDDIVEDLYHFLFECKTLRDIRQELFEEIETVIKSFYPDLAFSELPPFEFQKLQFLIGHRNNCVILH
jgi:hypothetical protein